jgi:hypothetical protein
VLRRAHDHDRDIRARLDPASAANWASPCCFKVVAASPEAQLGCKGRKAKFTAFYDRSSLFIFSAACLMARAQFMLRTHHDA